MEHTYREDYDNYDDYRHDKEEQERKDAREKEKEEEEERQKQKRLLEKKLQSEEETMRNIRKIKKEVDHLNDSINTCINLAAASLMSLPVNRRYNTMRQENNSSFTRTAHLIDEQASTTSKNISNLQNEQSVLNGSTPKESSIPANIPRL